MRFVQLIYDIIINRIQKQLFCHIRKTFKENSNAHAPWRSPTPPPFIYTYYMNLPSICTATYKYNEVFLFLKKRIMYKTHIQDGKENEISRKNQSEPLTCSGIPLTYVKGLRFWLSTRRITSCLELSRLNSRTSRRLRPNSGSST